MGVDLADRHDGLSFENLAAAAHPPALASIIIPTYNRKQLLAEAVGSCLLQTWSNLEIIIVDDGSTDGTCEFVAEQLNSSWAGRNVKYHHQQQNAGASAARNKGLHSAAGEYVQFLDSDDMLFREKIALQVSVLERPEHSTAAGCACYGTMGASVADSTSNRRIGVFCQSPKDYLIALSSRVVHGLQTSAPLWRRSFLQENAGWRTDITLGDDLEYHMRLLTQAKAVAFVDRELFWVREHDGPRLSDSFRNRERTRSAIRTRMAIADSLRSQGYWCSEIQKVFLSAVRTLYANVLEWGTVEDIIEIEKWLIGLARVPDHRPVLPLLITCRRVLGKSFLLGAHRLGCRLKGAFTS